MWRQYRFPSVPIIVNRVALWLDDRISGHALIW
jgi:hypothetical protein